MCLSAAVWNELSDPFFMRAALQEYGRQ